jgi:hypothetical protein
MQIFMKKMIPDLIQKCSNELLAKNADLTNVNSISFDVKYVCDTSLNIESHGDIIIDDVDYTYSVSIIINKK